MSWVWLGIAIAFEVTGTLSLRASNGFRKPLWLIPVAVGFTLSFIALSFSMREGMPVAVSYGVWTAVGIVAIAVLARFIWNDPLTRRMLWGIALIIAGVLLVRLG